MSSSGDAAADRLRDELLLSVYRFALLSVKYGVSDKDWFELDINNGDMLASGVLNQMFSGKRQREKSAQSAYADMPEYLETVIKYSEDLLRQQYKNMLDAD